ncbi:DNA polymerase III subunit delta [Nigerium massiliense]|uniref:DNA polymerase III subunit delta n=1 Tax=Nigerium massiliense TaxID=1522317 RepID=UPI001F44BAFB|nr:DNA polymerase III subunit delta [Nigerium massiliense]
MENQPVFGRVVLISGPEGLLAERAVARFVEQARTERPDASVTKVEASTLDAGALTEVTGGSLFAEASVVVVENLADLPPDLVDHVLALVATPVDDLALALVHSGGNKGKGLLDKLKKARVQVVDCPAIKPWELPQFAVAEARRAGGRLEPSTAATLVGALGNDARGVAAAVRQLLADADDATITDAAVRRYFAGRADVTSFNVADAVMAGRRNEALGQLRWALENGVAAVLLTSAMASGLRNMGKYLDARDARIRDADVARQIGVPPFKVRDLSKWSRDWTPRGVALALQCVARVDAEVKGASGDPEYSLEAMVLEVSSHHGRRPDGSFGG